MPIKAIFFLEQSDKDEVLPIETGRAVSEIFESYKRYWNTYWSRMDEERKKKRRLQAFENSVNLAKSTECYYLKATLYGQFWEEIEKVL